MEYPRTPQLTSVGLSRTLVILGVLVALALLPVLFQLLAIPYLILTSGDGSIVIDGRGWGEGFMDKFDFSSLTKNVLDAIAKYSEMNEDSRSGAQ